MTDDDNVSKLPVRFKKPVPEDRTLVLAWEASKGQKCSHLLTTYIVSACDAEVECEKCGTKLNPMWVLTKLATEDRRLEDARRYHAEETARLAERSRTKCEHCAKMTRISHR